MKPVSPMIVGAAVLMLTTPLAATEAPDALSGMASDVEALSRAEQGEQGESEPAGPPPPPPPESPSVFGTVAVPVNQTRMDERWRRILGAGTHNPVLARIAGTVAALTPDRQASFVQASLNRAIAYRTDHDNWGVEDYWATADETIARGSGDCEDIAIAKLQVLRRLGFPERDLYLMVGRDTGRGEHAALLVRMNDRFWVLDDRQERLVDAADFHTFQPVLTFGANMAWVHGTEMATGPIRAPMATE